MTSKMWMTGALALAMVTGAYAAPPKHRSQSQQQEVSKDNNKDKKQTRVKRHKKTAQTPTTQNK